MARKWYIIRWRSHETRIAWPGPAQPSPSSRGKLFNPFQTCLQFGCVEVGFDFQLVNFLRLLSAPQHHAVCFFMLRPFTQEKARCSYNEWNVVAWLFFFPLNFYLHLFFRHTYLEAGPGRPRRSHHRHRLTDRPIRPGRHYAKGMPGNFSRKECATIFAGRDYTFSLLSFRWTQHFCLVLRLSFWALGSAYPCCSLFPADCGLATLQSFVHIFFNYIIVIVNRQKILIPNTARRPTSKYTYRHKIENWTNVCVQ